ncbi:TIM barrel protein [Neorhizobium sp. CSC1952]|uniref:hydroxypyruvate isomerase family protein n=1 Tax=Neorhizobium sp. CSC1952 TaxID=2978974 RepID=UPI0025A634A1|nr:TIM barrel protein [Rhizobium sp. CSC1952]WJR65845.1 TIM barrel protein [Rhizobium sp. CSC1952]
MLTQFSANLGFLWPELELPRAIRRAAEAGFQAVECHWPYETPALDVKAALDETGLRMLCLNTRKGGVGESGLSALPGREADARAAIDEAIDYAVTTRTEAIHLMAGFGHGPEADEVFLTNIRYALANAPDDMMLLLEPLNPHDWPNYYLNSSEQAVRILDSLASPNARLMFDCYHVGRSGGGVIEELHALLPWIGHIQFASVPDRGPPGRGSIDYTQVFAVLEELAWAKPLGAEYRPDGSTEESLGWLRRFR